MILFGKKTIHFWKFWRTKRKLFFCLSSGAFYSVCLFIIALVTKAIMGHSGNMFETSFYLALGGFISTSFMSIPLWYENERRFKLWQEKEK